MSFVYPALLVGLVLVPLLGWSLARGERRRRADLERFGDPALLQRSSTLPGVRSWRIPHLLRIAALALAIVALARPQFGERPASRPRTGRSVLVLLDLSRSMNVNDVGSTRLVAAKQAIAQVIAASPGDEVGLVVFGGSAFLQLPFTADHAVFRTFLEAATSDDLGDPATDVANALRTAIAVFEHEGEPGPRAILLVSDGESGQSDVANAATAVRQAGIPVFAVGVGTPAGGPVPADSSAAPEQWHRDPIGRIVVSTLNENDLQLAASQTGGAYVRWSPEGGVGNLPAKLAQLETRTLSSTTAPQRADRFQWPLALTVLALMAELSAGVVSRRRRAVPILALLLACDSSSRAARRGERLYEEGRYRDSYLAFQRALEDAANPALAYNSGNALYRMRRYADAAKAYREAADSSPRLQRRAAFNLGNAYVRAAEEEEGSTQRQTLRRAVAAYEEALRLAPADTAAKWNLELALRRLGDDGDGGGSPGRPGRADYGRGDMDDPGYEGNEQAAVGAMAGGGYGSAEGESVEELSESEARQLLEAVQREQLSTHQGRPAGGGPTGERDW